MKTVSFVNVNFQQGPKEFNAHYLPYSVGILWGYAQQFPEIANNYQLGTFVWRRDDIDVAVNKLMSADIVVLAAMYGIVIIATPWPEN